GYAGNYKIINKASGTFTKLPHVGQEIKSGQVMYRVDGKPVIFLKGGTPIYRSLKSDLKGDDVKELNAALVALGYAAKRALSRKPGYFGQAPKDAVENPQDKLGLKQTGTTGTNQVVSQPGDRLRVTDVTATRGMRAAADSVAFQASSADRQI